MTGKRTLWVPVRLKEEKNVEFEERLRKVIEKTRKEPGCVFYRAFRISDRKFVFFEQWENDEFMHRHNESAHLRHFLEKIEEWVESPFDDIFLMEISAQDS